MMIVEERIVCWNCKGTASQEFACKLREILVGFRPKIVILMDPWISGKMKDKVCKKLGKIWWIRSEAVGFSGGIWVMWYDDDIWVKLKAMHRSFPHMEV